MNINLEKIMQPFSLHYFTIFKSLCTTVDNLQEIFFSSFLIMALW